MTAVQRVLWQGYRHHYGWWRGGYYLWRHHETFPPRLWRAIRWAWWQRWHPQLQGVTRALARRLRATPRAIADVSLDGYVAWWSGRSYTVVRPPHPDARRVSAWTAWWLRATVGWRRRWAFRYHHARWSLAHWLTVKF